MIAKLFDIKKTKNKGNGLFATVFIPKGTIIFFECKNCKKRTKKDLDNLSKEELKWVMEHEYKDETGLVSDLCDKTAGFFNHSCNANILDSGLGFDIVVRDIQKGEEATYDYRQYYDDSEVNCKCGEKNCCKIVRCIHPIPNELKEYWNKKIKSALKQIKKVPQPLKEELLSHSEKFKKYI